MCSDDVLVVIFLEFLFLYVMVVSSDSIHTNQSDSTTLRQSDNSCILPPYPQFGQWSIFPISTHMRNAQLRPGDRVPHGTVLHVNCKTNYKLEGDAGVVCGNAKWTSEIGRCLKKCPPLYSTPTVTVTCTNNITQTVSCEEATDGTRARFACADFYENLGIKRQPYSFCFNGKWSRNDIPECVPICGQKVKKSPTLIVKGRNVTRGEYPWQIALYDFTDKNLICGGSLLNQRVVLTAAHCVTDDNNKLLPKELFMLAAGKYFRNYDDPRDKNEAQFSRIFDMYIPENYKGDIQNYFGDIAVIISKKTFLLSNNVQPVCIDWTFRYSSSLTTAKKGYVTGWGYTAENKNPSDVLKELEVPLIPDKTCLHKLPEDYSKYMTDDKLCAGYLDSGISVCRGDSGGGLVVQNRGRYYLVAVVSISPQAPTSTGGCDSRQYALYTKISYYIEKFVLEKEALFRSYQNSSTLTNTEATTSVSTILSSVAAIPRGYCILPQHPKSGRWKIFQANVTLFSGMPVSPGTVLQIMCNKGHVLIGQTTSLCHNGEWSSKNVKCLRTCPSLYSTETVEVTCTFKNNELENCDNPWEGTIARQQCSPFYEDLQFTKNAVRVCRNGSWDLPKAECVPICGRKTQKSNYPWHVNLYRARNKTFVCSGTLISQNVILTAAHCVTDAQVHKVPKNDYLVAVGKYFRDFYSSLDIDAQIFRIKAIFIPREYKGLKNNYLGDIAMLVTENVINLSEKIQPVCVDWGLKYETSELLSGYITRWNYTLPNANLSETLRESQVQIDTRQECSEQLHTFIADDKLCVMNHTSVCDSNPGGALVSEIEDRYYIVAVASTAHLTLRSGCDGQKYALYTKVSDYNTFLLEKEAQFKPDRDCANNEDSSVCQKLSGSCILPEHPESGRWSAFLYDRPVSDLSPGDYMGSGGLLQIACGQGHKLKGSNIITCYEGQWSSEVGHCFKVCPDVNSTASIRVTCLLPNGEESKNCIEAANGTIARFTCAPYYEDPTFKRNLVSVCLDGSWDFPPPRCEPVCGRKTVDATRLIIGGTTVTRVDYPWQVAIYRSDDKSLICGGSLLNQRVILTAAQCITDKEGKLNSKDLYIVAVGKNHPQFNDSRDFDGAQFSQLTNIFISEQYAGPTGNHVGDIAILVTKKQFILSSKVLPVCLENGGNYDDDFGYIAGWGYTKENDQRPDALKELMVPLEPSSHCRENLPQDSQNYLTRDKLCAGYLDKSAAVCGGDSGGGLVFKRYDRYFVAGIVSSSPKSASDGCGSQQFAFYTKVSSYMTFITEKLRKYGS